MYLRADGPIIRFNSVYRLLLVDGGSAVSLPATNSVDWHKEAPVNRHVLQYNNYDGRYSFSIVRMRLTRYSYSWESDWDTHETVPDDSIRSDLTHSLLRTRKANSISLHTINDKVNSFRCLRCLLACCVVRCRLICIHDSPIGSALFNFIPNLKCLTRAKTVIRAVYMREFFFVNK